MFEEKLEKLYEEEGKEYHLLPMLEGLSRARLASHPREQLSIVLKHPLSFVNFHVFRGQVWMLLVSSSYATTEKASTAGFRNTDYNRYRWVRAAGISHIYAAHSLIDLAA
jgi:hypothetical protein